MTLEPVTGPVLERLRAALPAAAFRDPEAYLTEPRGTWQGRAGVVVAPASAEEAAAVVRIAAAARVGIVPYGGGTGLVGGQVADVEPAPIVLSLERMRAIRLVDPLESVMVVEAGAVLAEVQAAAEEVGRLFPLWLGSGGSARVGGLLSTNAGGVNVLRYGNARDLVLGLEAVLPDGQVWHGLRRLRKDNTGYDLRHLLIGAEGTLGVITAASLRLFPRPAHRVAALLVVAEPRAALELLALAQETAGPALTAFELISGQGLAFLAETGQGPRSPLADVPDWCVLMELATPADGSPDATLEDLFAAAAQAEITSDGVISQSEAQRADLWALREAIPEANRAIGAIASHDVSLPLAAIPSFLDEASEAVAGLAPLRINVFGHLGDGNLHYNVFPPAGRDRAEFRDRADAIRRAVHDLVAAHDGSFSAEHGIGRLKVADLERYADPAKLWAMRRIKMALDPLGIMNPGAVLRTE